MFLVSITTERIRTINIKIIIPTIILAFDCAVYPTANNTGPKVRNVVGGIPHEIVAAAPFPSLGCQVVLEKIVAPEFFELEKGSPALVHGGLIVGQPETSRPQVMVLALDGQVDAPVVIQIEL